MQPAVALLRDGKGHGVSPLAEERLNESMCLVVVSGFTHGGRSSGKRNRREDSSIRSLRTVKHSMVADWQNSPNPVSFRDGSLSLALPAAAHAAFK